MTERTNLLKKRERDLEDDGDLKYIEGEVGLALQNIFPIDGPLQLPDHIVLLPKTMPTASSL